LVQYIHNGFRWVSKFGLGALDPTSQSDANEPSRRYSETGVSDNIFAIDVEKGEAIWKKHFVRGYTPPLGGRHGGTLCPGGITVTPVSDGTVYAFGFPAEP
jgi:hypothetical protein